jgi:radical SAM superfamily enzyme YgiQ (UPF0313 family)
VEPVYSVPVVTEATRGCPFRCSYCQLNIQPTAHRCRPVADVLRDLTATQGLPLPKRKMAMLYDNNLGGDMVYAKELLRGIADLDLWGIGVQFSLNCLRDEEFLDLLERARCRMAFLGMESLQEASLHVVQKRQNRVGEYRERFEALKKRGILIFAGTMIGLDEDTPAYLESLPDKLEEVDPSAIFLSISIPIPGTPFHREVEAAGRIVDRDLSHYEGDHLLFEPRKVSPADIYRAYRNISLRFYSWRSIGRRWGRLMKAFLGSRHLPRRLGPAVLLTFILLKLSVFQREHARRKVFPLLDEAEGVLAEGRRAAG